MTQFYLQIWPYLPLPRKCSPHGATTNWREKYNCNLLLIYRPRKDGRLSWPGWLTCSGRSPVSYRSSAGQGKFAGQIKISVLSLYHCTTIVSSISMKSRVCHVNSRVTSNLLRGPRCPQPPTIVMRPSRGVLRIALCLSVSLFVRPVRACKVPREICNRPRYFETKRSEVKVTRPNDAQTRIAP